MRLRARAPQTDWISIATELAEHGIAIRPRAVSEELTRALQAEAAALREDGAFDIARIGTGAARQYNPEIRGDYIHWLDPARATEAQHAWLGQLDELREAVNAATWLGLFEWEGHLAHYPPGAHYRRHLDVFKEHLERKVTTVLYLNHDWREGDGGELRVYTNGADLDAWIDIPPAAGLLVTFLAEEVYHEVRPAMTDRYSVTGWFRVRSLRG